MLKAGNACVEDTVRVWNWQ